MSLRTGAARLITIAACGGAAVLSSTAHCAAAPSGKLMDMLPQGFSATNCQEKAPVEGALERVMCGQSSDPGGPSYAVFLLYGSGSDLATEFRQGPGRSGYTVASSCPGGGASPGTWSYRNSSQTAGQVECGTSVEGNYAVIWTDNAKLRLAVVEGKNSASLYQWWRDKG
ncbi:hypothetical protein [Mycobacterium persicum]|uniref:Serine/threonine protein kinase n=1 Tax=Mycobacterium persicum TaxID=1487726 RepID=A0AB38UUN6_9MYCO|nr:hypothetical protein [Mycobacterium persicum]ORB33570.1 hypothetical protein BST40_26290 [Mycobacterium persicum]ORB88237.1 hypothetical protein B1T49_01820 [Mycobacterium persicum]VAZ84211.1 hypothetical protein LAUMK42_03030 [Mycobacterium persicum]